MEEEGQLDEESKA